MVDVRSIMANKMENESNEDLNMPRAGTPRGNRKKDEVTTCMDTSDENRGVMKSGQENIHDNNPFEQAKAEEESTDPYAEMDKKWAEKPGARAGFNRGAKLNDDGKEESKDVDTNAASDFDDTFNKFSAMQSEIRSTSQVTASQNEETKDSQSGAQAAKSSST